MKKTNILIAALSALLFSMGAFASDGGTSAAGSPETGGNGGVVTGCSYLIQKIGNTFAERDEEIAYHIIVKNTGTCRLQHIHVRDHLPRELTFISAYPPPSEDHDRTLEWNDLDLKAGRFIDLVIKAKVNHEFDRDFDNRMITNTACAFDRRIGIRICDSSTLTVIRDFNDSDGHDAILQ